jgi:hypothetical protein
MTSSPSSVVAAAIAVASLVCNGCAHSAERGTASRPGSIAGRILHPAQANPPMRICAIGSGPAARATRICVKTRAGQTRYRIAGLPSDHYVVIGRAGSGALSVAGHVQPVHCIRAPCPDMAAPVVVAPGARITGIDLNGFYERREDFPRMPEDD